MNYLGIAELAAGQKYSEPVIIEQGNLLVPAGIAIRKKDLDFLKSLGITEVMTEGTLISGEPVAKGDLAFSTGKAASSSKNAPSQAASADGKKPAGEKPIEETYRKLIACIRQLDIVFNEITKPKPTTGNTKNSVSLRHLWAITSVLLQLAKEHRASCLNFILGSSGKESRLAKSSVNTTILAILIARELEFDIQQIPEVAAGALLHDIGMLRLPRDIVKKHGKLSLEEVQIIQSHTAHSYQIITKELAYSPAVAAIALQHHERWDGTGYPHRLVGNAIDRGACVVCVADAFEAMVCEKPYRNPMTGYLAVKTMVSENAAHFAPNILKAFIKIIGMYPIGSGVVLNDKRIARVVTVNSEAPLRPTVQIIADAGAQPVKNGEILDLTSHKNMFIVKTFDLNKLSSTNYHEQ